MSTGTSAAVTPDAPARPYTWETGVGRVDRDGIEWFACDPYPTWFRWVDGKLITKTLPDFADREADELRAGEMAAIERLLYSNGPHQKGCDRKVRAKSIQSGGGISCPCGARWFCY